MPRRRPRRFWWHAVLRRVRSQGFVSSADVAGLRVALLHGNQYAQRLLRRECDRLQAAGDALLLDMLLCLEYDTDEVASALVHAEPGLWQRVSDLLRDIE